MKSMRPRTILIVLLIAFFALIPTTVLAEENKSEGVEQIRMKLIELENRRKSVEQKLDLAYRSMDDVRRSSGFGDLAIKEYRHPVEERVIRLTNIVDDLQLDIANLEGHAKQKASKEYDNETKGKLAALTSKLQTAQQLLQQAKKDNARLEDARVQYQRRKALKDNLLNTSNDIKKLVEKYRIKACFAAAQENTKANAEEPSKED